MVEGVQRAAYLRFKGGYDQTSLLYERSLDWMEKAGARIAGPVREVYIRFGADQCGYTLPPRVLACRDSEYETELQIPLASV
jgi:hypothetical protein